MKVFPSAEGLAQSQLRDLVFALPEGMSVGPSLTASSGGCTEADLEAEGPESAGKKPLLLRNWRLKVKFY